MRLFSGTSNRPLAEKIAQELGIVLGNAEITRFADGECRVFVKDNVAGQDVYVLQSLSEVADQHLVELCLLGSALKDLGVKNVTAIIPWLGYSKQDKAFRKGEAVSVQFVAKCIEAAGFDRVIACELHSPHVLTYFRIPVIDLPTGTLLVSKHEHAVVVSPDKGGVSRSERFAKENGFPILHLDKSRDLATGEVLVSDIDGDVSGKTVIIYDDIINTGETAIKTSAFVKARGATSVYFLATHAVLAGNAPQVLEASDIDKVIITDTIHVPKRKLFPKLTIISLSHEIASQIT